MSHHPAANFPEIRILTPADFVLFRDLICLFRAVFGTDTPLEASGPHLQCLLESPQFLALVAVDGDTVIGGLTAYVLSGYYSSRPQAYLYDLAVAEDRQRQGMGRRLVAALNDHCAAAGFEAVFVQADGADGEAQEFYRSVGGGSGAAVVHFTFPL